VVLGGDVETASETNRNFMSRPFDKTDTGTLGDNRYKEADKHPDLTGKLEALSPEVIAAITAGKQVRLAGWWRDGRDGKFLSLRVSTMRERAEQPSDAGVGTQRQWASTGPNAKPARGTIEGNLALKGMDPDAPFDDDIPF
jgi:hypothetical protein